MATLRGSVSGIEAARFGLSYEYDPYFSLSISRVDPLPHQLEAVYDYFMRLPRIPFLLADDSGAGKTIMAGLLLKELKICGLWQRRVPSIGGPPTFRLLRGPIFSTPSLAKPHRYSRVGVSQLASRELAQGDPC